MKKLPPALRPLLLAAAVALLAVGGGCQSTATVQPTPHNPGPHPREGKDSPMVGNPGPHS